MTGRESRAAFRLRNLPHPFQNGPGLRPVFLNAGETPALPGGVLGSLGASGGRRGLLEIDSR